jgi:TaqI-like C-terminal specificity domain
LKRPKLVGVITEDEPILARDDAQFFATDGAYLFGVRDTVNCNYLLGIMNSQLIRFLYRLAATETNRVLAQVKPAVLGTLPVIAVNLADPSDKGMHDSLAKLADRMLELSERKHSSKLPRSEVTQVEREIAATDTEIDNLVYDLYGITKEERKIIEGSKP